jgi:hypothetical protein
MSGLAVLAQQADGAVSFSLHLILFLSSPRHFEAVGGQASSAFCAGDFS